MLSSLEKRLSLLYHRGRNESERRDKNGTAFHHRQSRHRQNPPLHRGNHPSIEYGSETADSHCARAVHLTGGTGFDCRNRQNAILTAEVLSFGRLAHRVFSKKGIGNRLPLGDIGKAMALRKILLAEKDNISYFHSVLEQPGFIDQLGLTISEFFQYRISPEDTETLAQAEGLSHAAREKLTDLNRIYRSYLDFLRQEYISADETLGLLAERLDESLGFADTEFWLDGFYGFTPQEYSVIRRLLQLSAQVNITLPMDKNSFYGAFLPPSAPFYEPYLTKKKLLALAEELQLAPVLPTLLEKNFRAETDALRNLEQEYFHSFFRKAPLAESVHVVACPSLQEEIRFAAAKSSVWCARRVCASARLPL